MSTSATTAAASRMSVRDFLAMPKADRPKVLKEEPVELTTTSGVTLTLTVRQLSQAQTQILNDITIKRMPVPPTVEQTYTQHRRDPNNPNRVLPPGVYKEQNTADPAHQKAMDGWFTDSCVIMGFFAAADDLGVDVSSPDAEGEFLSLGTEFGPDFLVKLSDVAAKVNLGLPLADQLIRQRMQEDAVERLRSEYRRIVELTPDQLKELEVENGSNPAAE